jgi:hypothetical protein
MDAWTTVLRRLLAQQQWHGDAGTIGPVSTHALMRLMKLDIVGDAASPGKLLRYSSQEWILC